MKPCIATFRPQAWINDYAADIDKPVQFDATLNILALTLEEFKNFKENSYDSDSLADDLPERENHSGPFEVDVDVDTWLEQNGFPERNALTITDWTVMQAVWANTPEEQTDTQ